MEKLFRENLNGSFLKIGHLKFPQRKKSGRKVKMRSTPISSQVLQMPLSWMRFIPGQKMIG